MTHSITDNDSIEVVETGDLYWDSPKAKPEERMTRGFDMEKYFGTLAGPDEEDDAPGRTVAFITAAELRFGAAKRRLGARRRSAGRTTAITGGCQHAPFEPGRELSMRGVGDRASSLPRLR